MLCVCGYFFTFSILFVVPFSFVVGRSMAVLNCTFSILHRSFLLCSVENCFVVLRHVLYLLSGTLEGLCCMIVTSCLLRRQMGEKVPSNLRKMRKFRSSCSCKKCHQGHCFPFVHSLISSDSISGQQRRIPTRERNRLRSRNAPSLSAHD